MTESGVPSSLPRRSLPLQVKLVATMVALLVVGLVATGVTASASLHTYLLNRVDSTLTDTSRTSDLIRHLGGHGPGEHTLASGTYYAAAFTSDGALIQLESTASDAGQQPRLPAITTADALRLSGHPFTVNPNHDGPPWRVAIGPIVSGPDVTGVYVVAIGLSDIHSTENRLAQIELLVGAGVLVLLMVAGFLMVRSSLRPLVEVERTAEAIAAGDLSRRVPDLDPRTEVGRLSRAFNTMLSRIESAFAAQQASESAARASEEKMRRFVADASHELRTPLTSIRGFAELYRMGAVETPADLDRNMGRVETEAQRMGALVDDLLLLARLDQQRPLEREPVDLAALAADAVHDLRAVSRDRAVTVSGPASAMVLGDEMRLRQVLANLLSNAVTHTPAGTAVDVVVSDSDGWVEVAVADSGPGMTPEEASRVFERFFRVDASRTRAHGGSGLGLSIVAGLVAAHGGTVSVRTSPGEGATFLVRLPAAPVAGPQAGAE